jgi:hypothetical protein
MSRVDDSFDPRVFTVGCPLPNAEVKVVSTTTGDILPVGEMGELCVRGFLNMKDYDGDPAATAATIDQEGWLHTGDLAIMQPNGYFRRRGRAKETIIRGGENIYPREVEEYLHTHPKVAAVYVVGLPGWRLGETVRAWIRLKPGETATEDEIHDFCRGAIDYFKVPQYIRFVDSFPMTVINKVRKSATADWNGPPASPPPEPHFRSIRPILRSARFPERPRPCCRAEWVSPCLRLSSPRACASKVRSVPPASSWSKYSRKPDRAGVPARRLAVRCHAADNWQKRSPERRSPGSGNPGLHSEGLTTSWDSSPGMLISQ